MRTVFMLYREARRRKVFRTAALYVVGAWVALQAAALSFPGFGIPDSAIRAAIWAAVLGFPVAIVFGWLFEIGPDGVRRTLPADVDAATEPRPLTRRDYALLASIVVVALAVVYQAVDAVRETPAEQTAVELAAVPEARERLANSIAVLPFTNISNDPENEYFCDGISEEILNDLSGVRDLTVIGRTSSFAFKGSNASIDRISALLGVRYVLQGSVRKAGRQLRISAQLLDETGRQLWTETFDRDLADVFAIQDEIARAVVPRVASELVSRREAAPRPNLAAYDHYLAGRARLHQRDVDRAMEELQRAVELDPTFAEAHAEWAIARLMGSPTADQLKAARAAIDRALELKPKLLRAQAAQGFLLSQTDPRDLAGAEMRLRSVLEQDPNMSDALLWLSNVLSAERHDDEALAILQRAERVDPLHPSIALNLADRLMVLGEVDRAAAIVHRQLEQPYVSRQMSYRASNIFRAAGRLTDMRVAGRAMSLKPAGTHFALVASYAMIGDWAAVDYWLERGPRDFPEWPFHAHESALALAWRGRAEEAAETIEAAPKASPGADLSTDLIVRSIYGTALAYAGRNTEAIAVLEPKLDQLLDRDYATPPSTWGKGRHSLAWAYLQSGAVAKAEALLTRLWEDCQADLASDWSRDSDLLHYCAENALLRGDHDRALDLFEQAVAAGWREYHLRKDDPYWEALSDDPRYRALMNTVKADVDRQAAEIARIDAADNLVADVDAAIAASRAQDQ